MRAPRIDAGRRRSAAASGPSRATLVVVRARRGRRRLRGERRCRLRGARTRFGSRAGIRSAGRCSSWSRRDRRPRCCCRATIACCANAGAADIVEALLGLPLTPDESARARQRLRLRRRRAVRRAVRTGRMGGRRRSAARRSYLRQEQGQLARRRERRAAGCTVHVLATFSISRPRPSADCVRRRRPGATPADVTVRLSRRQHQRDARAGRVRGRRARAGADR